jgi:hypothetical protein
MDRSLTERIARGEGLRPIMVMATAAVLVGGGLYGFTFGMWRSVVQGVYSAVKLPLLILAVVACTVLINGLLAIVLRSRLTIRQSAVCVLLSLSITAVLLGALSPISFFFVSQVAPPLEGIAELDSTDPHYLENHRVAQLVLIFHVIVIAICGVVGNVRLFKLLEAVTGSRAVARRLLITWLAVDGFVGAQLSWLLRPFLCKPDLEPQFLRDDAFRGNFFEEIWGILFASSASVAVILSLLLVALVLIFFGLAVRALVRYTPRQRAWANVADDGLDIADVTGRVTLVPFGFIDSIALPRGGTFGGSCHIDIDLKEEISFLKRHVRLMTSRSDEADQLYDLVTDGCARVAQAQRPYR